MGTPTKWAIQKAWICTELWQLAGSRTFDTQEAAEQAAKTMGRELSGLKFRVIQVTID